MMIKTLRTLALLVLLCLLSLSNGIATSGPSAPRITPHQLEFGGKFSQRIRTQKALPTTIGPRLEPFLSYAQGLAYRTPDFREESFWRLKTANTTDEKRAALTFVYGRNAADAIGQLTQVEIETLCDATRNFVVGYNPTSSREAWWIHHLKYFDSGRLMLWHARINRGEASLPAIIRDLYGNADAMHALNLQPVEKAKIMSSIYEEMNRLTMGSGEGSQSDAASSAPKFFDNTVDFSARSQTASPFTRHRQIVDIKTQETDAQTKTPSSNVATNHKSTQHSAEAVDQHPAQKHPEQIDITHNPFGAVSRPELNTSRPTIDGDTQVLLVEPICTIRFGRNQKSMKLRSRPTIWIEGQYKSGRFTIEPGFQRSPAIKFLMTAAIDQSTFQLATSCPALLAHGKVSSSIKTYATIGEAAAVTRCKEVDNNVVVDPQPDNITSIAICAPSSNPIALLTHAPETQVAAETLARADTRRHRHHTRRSASR